MPNYVDLGARLLALRKMTFPSADKALSYCRSLGVPGLRAKKVAHGRLFYEVGDEIRTVHILIHGISNVIVHSFDGTTFTLYENDGFTMYGLSETFSGDTRFGATIRAKTDCCVLEIAVAPFLAAVQHDVVLANIVADVIIPLSRVVPEFLQEDSIFICSGILNTRLDEVLAALEKNGLQILSTEQQEDWCRVTAALAEA